jgi:NMD protein affecting ribosome stability and mRNA decay
MIFCQCINCGRDVWGNYELKNGLCPSCQEEEFEEEDFEEEDFEN